MTELYGILQDTQAQVDRMVTGLKKATLFESPPLHNANAIPSGGQVYSHASWRNTVMSVYVDAEEEYPPQNLDHGLGGEGGSGTEVC